MANFVPAGTILPYASDSTSQLSGWAACNGASLNTANYPDLFAIIGYSNGGSGSTFYLPDLRGRFLRGASSTQGPGATAPFSTYSPFSLPLQFMPNTYHNTDEGAIGPASRNMVDWNSGSNTFNVSGGDHETRPVNVYMNFVIKLTNAAPILVGGLVPYAGDDASPIVPNETQYIFCDGNEYKSSTFSALSGAIGTRFMSGKRTGYFSVPEIDGQFIRGVAIPGGIDPDVSTRLPAPDGTTGSAVGTIQTYGTSAQGLNVSIVHFPPSGSKEVFPTAGHSNLQASSNTGTTPFKGDGSKETRPNNVYVSYYIKATTSADSTDFPIGGIIAIPGTGTVKPNAASWALCDGSSIAVASNPTLYQALQNAWGQASNGSSFNLPNLNDQFLRATDTNDASTPDPYGDPDRNARIASNPGGVTTGTGSKQTFATALPQTPFSIANFSYPTGEVENAATAIGYSTSEFNSTTRTFAVGGGSAETAPASVAATFYIKIA